MATGLRLKNIPSTCAFGTAIWGFLGESEDEVARRTIVDNEFNLVQVGDGMTPWTGVDTYDFGYINAAINWCVNNNKETWVFWMFGNDMFLPTWVKNGTWTNEELDGMVEDCITALLSSNSNNTKVDIWCVLNELFEMNGTYRTMKLNQLGWEDDESGLIGADRINAQHPTFIGKVLGYFRNGTQAKLEIREAPILNNFPNAVASARCKAFYQLIKHLKQRGIPLDAVSEQAHFDLSHQPHTGGTPYAWNEPCLPADELRTNVARLIALGVEVYFSELDIGTGWGRPITWTTELAAQQRQDYEGVVTAAIQAGISKISTWGIQDGFDTYWRTDQNPLLWDNNLAYKEAYYGVQAALMARVMPENDVEILCAGTPSAPANLVVAANTPAEIATDIYDGLTPATLNKVVVRREYICCVVMEISPWWLKGGVSATNVMGAYQPLGTPSLMQSYKNLASPGVYDAFVVSPQAPTLDSDGWGFNGLDQCLQTGIYGGLGTVNISALIRFSNSQGSLYGLHCGAQNWDGTRHFLLSPWRTASDPDAVLMRNGNGQAESTPPLSSGVLGIAGNQAYIDGVAYGSPWAVEAWTPSEGFSFGGLRSSAQRLYGGWSIQAAAIYNIILTADQMAAITAAMRAL